MAIEYNKNDSWIERLVNYDEASFYESPWIRTYVNINWESRPAKWQDLGLNTSSKGIYEKYLEEKAKGSSDLNTWLKANSDFQTKWLDKVIARRYVVRYTGHKDCNGSTIDQNLITKALEDDGDYLKSPDFFIEGDNGEGMSTSDTTTITGLQIISNQNGFVRVQGEWVDYGEWKLLAIDGTYPSLPS